MVYNKYVYCLDVCGSMHHSIIHKENPTRCNSVSKFDFIFIWSSACFGRHTAHHQEAKTALAASTYAKPEAASAVLDSWWWAVFRPKHVELHIYMKWNFDTLLLLVGFYLWIMFIVISQYKATYCTYHFWISSTGQIYL